MWSLVVVGLTEGVVTSPFLNPLRVFVYSKKSLRILGYLMGCRSCSSFWVALAVSYYYMSPTSNLFWDALLGSGAVVLLHSVVRANHAPPYPSPYSPPPYPPSGSQNGDCGCDE